VVIICQNVIDLQYANLKFAQ